MCIAIPRNPTLSRTSALRRGHVLHKLLGVGCVAAAVMALKLVNSPSSSLARTSLLAVDQHTRRAQEEFENAFTRVLENSRAILAVHHRGTTPYEEIVVWREDADNHG